MLTRPLRRCSNEFWLNNYLTSRTLQPEVRPSLLRRRLNPASTILKSQGRCHSPAVRGRAITIA
jgi:hypothetical protein